LVTIGRELNQSWRQHPDTSEHSTGMLYNSFDLTISMHCKTAEAVVFCRTVNCENDCETDNNIKQPKRRKVFGDKVHFLERKGIEYQQNACSKLLIMYF
jgi:hypothetical protein